MAGEQRSHGPSPAKKPRLSFTDYIEVIVGKDRKSFSVHKNIICARSPFFKAACSELWNKSENKLLELPEDDPDLFDIYLHCVYSNNVDVGYIKEAWSESEAHEVKGAREYMRLVGTYLIADKYQDTVTTNMIVDARTSDAQVSIPSTAATIIVASTMPADSPLYRLFVDYYVHEVGVFTIRSAFSNGVVPYSFVFRVLEEKTRLETENRKKVVLDVFHRSFTTLHKCKYHQHDEQHPSCGEDCKKRK